MTTATTTTIVDQSTDATFRVWVAEFIAQMVAVGLTQTADTGQINTLTVTRAAINTDAGYVVFRFNDTQQATAPVFFKVMFGSGGTTSTPRIRVQVGTASNGSGTISGTGSANTDIVANTINVSSITTYTSYFCCVDGCFWWSWKVAAGGNPNVALSAYAINRSTDNTGVASADAVCQAWASNTSTWTARSISFLTSTIYGGAGVTGTSWLLQHYGVSTSLVAGVPQVYKSYMITPRVRPMLQLLQCIPAEIGFGIQFTATAVGTTSRNYINATTFNSNGTGMIWE